MTVLQTVLFLAVIPAAVYGLVMLIVLWPRLIRSNRRASQQWDFPPVLWVANPAGVSPSSPPSAEQAEAAPGSEPGTARGGARGSW
ncbi:MULTISPECIES: hypothetical protein [Actinopolyspora]|uniref:Uncharacterized protein n=1 Tax=Actinopolyspora saharensis TaxID=995062 RepID=A0A1H1DKM9_9ACTN|nr:hypothetical protein [Actinopolyspora saharensis]NHD18420.1 hypothetical protein [Actinopolyspora sp. BKK2]NHE77621.1 hypothetical protein [Actinopolyspora sp. BKK1]SDQ77043.1 hypothetical protein SAMN04489718_2125 [Actinopolyspora saharensis]